MMLDGRAVVGADAVDDGIALLPKMFCHHTDLGRLRLSILTIMDST